MDDKALLLHIWQRIVEFPMVKVLTGLGLWLLKLLFGAAFRPVYGAVIFLWLADTASGFYNAWINPAERPNSRRLYHGLVKLGTYLFLLALGYQCSQAELTLFIRAAIEGFILFTESYSILENLQAIGRAKGQELPILDQVMRAIQGRLNDPAGVAPVQAGPERDGNG